MDAIEKRARELLADVHAQAGWPGCAKEILLGEDKFDILHDLAIAAIIAALTPPEGYVLMPVESTPEIELAIVDWLEGRSNTGDCYTAILAARPNHIAHDLKMVASRTDHSEHYLDMVNPMSVPDGFVRVPADLVKAVEDLSLIYEAGGDIDSKLSEIEAMLAACPEVKP